MSLSHQILFEIAQQNTPSVIFIDEIDSFASKRDTFGDHEATKRFKNEFLTLLDGFGTEKYGVFTLVTSNMPW
jgi:SpoVK/Ycf46/Vps4 family AAA+-type ATPase